MKQNVQYKVNQIKKGIRSVDIPVAIRITDNNVASSDSPFFSLMLKPHVIQQITDNINNSNSSESELNDEVSIEFLSEKEALLWISKDIHYKMNISSLLRSDENNLISVENQDEIYCLSTDDVNNCNNHQLDFVGKVTNRLIPIQHLHNNANLISSESSTPRSSYLHSPRNNNDVATTRSIILEEDISHLSNPNQYLKPTKEFIHSSSSSSSSSATKAILNITSKTMKTQLSSPLSPISSSLSVSSMLVLRQLHWNVADTAIHQFFSPLPIIDIFVTKSNTSSPSSSSSVTTAVNISNNVKTQYLDYYIRFSSTAEADIAFLRNNEIIKYNTINDIAAVNDISTSTNHVRDLAAIKSVSSVTVSTPAQIDKVGYYESIWALSIGIPWSSHKPTPTPTTSTGLFTIPTRSYYNEDWRNTTRSCQERYLLITSIIGELYSDTSLHFIMNKSPTQLISIYNDIDITYLQPFSNIQNNNKTNNTSTANKRKPCVYSEGKRSRCKYISNSNIRNSNIGNMSSNISSNNNNNNRLCSFWQERLRYAGINLFDNNILFYNQSSYYYNNDGGDINNASTAHTTTSNTNTDVEKGSFSRNSSITDSEQRAIVQNRNNQNTSKKTSEQLIQIKQALEIVFLLLMKSQLSIVEYISTTPTASPTTFTNQITQNSPSRIATLATKSCSNDLLLENQNNYNNYTDDMIVFEQMSRLIEILYAIYRYYSHSRGHVPVQ